MPVSNRRPQSLLARQSLMARRCLTAAAVAAFGLGAFAACSPPSPSSSTDADRTETLPFTGTELTVKNDFADVAVETGDPGEVTVRENRTVVGIGAKDPDWTLTEDGTLDLGKPCASTVGVCEVSYLITVPEGVTVTPMDTVEDAE